MKYDPNMIRGVAEPIILQLVSEQARYGYEIIKVVNERTNGEFEWKEGTLYPCLHRLENEGYIISEWQVAENGRKRKYYSLTMSGLSLLKDKAVEWKTFSRAVTAVLCGRQLSPR